MVLMLSMARQRTSAGIYSQLAYSKYQTHTCRCDGCAFGQKYFCVPAFEPTADSFRNFQSPTLTLDVLLSWGTIRFTSVQVNIEQGNQSNYSFVSLVRVAILILTVYSTMPLRLASWTVSL